MEERWGDGHEEENCRPRSLCGVDGVLVERTSLALSSLVSELFEERKDASRFIPWKESIR